MTPVGPIAELREEIEVAAQDGTLDASSRLTKLRDLDTQMRDLLGLAETYISDVELERDGAADRVTRERMELRQNADIRDEMVRRGMATEEEMEEAGYLSHETLDQLAEEGALEEAELVSRLTANARAAIVKNQWRGRGGRWIDMPDAIDTSPGDGGGESVASKLAKGNAPESSADVDTKVGTDAPDDKQKFLKTKEREDKEATDAAQAGLESTTPAERHFNAAGKTSQRTFLSFVNLSANQPTTTEKYAVREPDGTITFDESRRELHERIIDMFLRQRTFNAETDEWELSADAPYLAGVDNPEVMFSGGGYAAGKSSVMKRKRKEGLSPDPGYDGPPLILDPDQIKAQLPEFADALGSDPEANLLVYEEAWEIAQEVQARAAERKINMIVDGISNTDPEEMLERVSFFADQGYAARAVYVDIPTEEALKRANMRMQNATDDSDKRFIPEVIMRSVHRDVAATVPALIERLKSEGVVLDLEIWDNDQGKDDDGNWRPPARFIHYDPVTGEVVIDDESLWERFQKKAEEKLPGVES